MAKGLNFRNFEQPTFPINMNDAAETLFTCVAPTVELIERLEANKDTIIAVFGAKDRASVEELWKLTADLISCNREGRKVTAEELKGKYGMSYSMLGAFIVGYGEFVNEIKYAKN
jgi:hypothetical protein